MARALAGLDALVAGIDNTAYLKQLQSTSEACSYPAEDFEGLSQYLLRHYGFTDYVVPVLGGYSSGATLVYATLAQAPPNTFRGGMSLGFCPDLPLTRPLCHGSGLKSMTGPHGKGYSFKPAPDLPPPGAPSRAKPTRYARPPSARNSSRKPAMPALSACRTWVTAFPCSATGCRNSSKASTSWSPEHPRLPRQDQPAWVTCRWLKCRSGNPAKPSQSSYQGMVAGPASTKVAGREPGCRGHPQRRPRFPALLLDAAYSG